jgi:hypothetical protein
MNTRWFRSGIWFVLVCALLGSAGAAHASDGSGPVMLVNLDFAGIQLRVWIAPDATGERCLGLSLTLEPPLSGLPAFALNLRQPLR